VVAWTAYVHGWSHPEERVTEHRATFVVEEKLEFEDRLFLVVKRSGKYWNVKHDPMSRDLYTARTRRQVRESLLWSGLDPDKPDGIIPPVPRKRIRTRARRGLDSWIRREWPGADVFDGGWYYLVSRGQLLPGNMPEIVLKSDGSVWRQSSGAPVPFTQLADEPAFHAYCAATVRPPMKRD
jgi:hypothetical protein